MQTITIGNKQYNVAVVRQWTKYTVTALEEVAKKHHITLQDINIAMSKLPAKTEREHSAKRVNDLVCRINAHNAGLKFTAVLNGILLGHIKTDKITYNAITEFAEAMRKFGGERGMFAPLTMLPDTINPNKLFTMYCATWEGDRYQYFTRYNPNAKSNDLAKMLKDRKASECFRTIREAVASGHFPELKDLIIGGGILVEVPEAPNKNKSK